MTKIGAYTALQDAFGKEQAQLLAEYVESQNERIDLSKLATKEDLNRFATKEDLNRFATKEDLTRFATKEDLNRFATKEDLNRFATKEDFSRSATKEDLIRFTTKEDQKDLEIRLLKEIQKTREDLMTRMQWTAFIQIITTIAALIGLSKLM